MVNDRDSVGLNVPFVHLLAFPMLGQKVCLHEEARQELDVLVSAFPHLRP